MKKNNILVRIICCTVLLLTSFGCRTYRGYREYVEKTDLTAENEKVIDSFYNLNFQGDKLIVSEIKKIYWTQNIRIDNIEEKIYTDQNGTLGHLIFSPFLLAISPLAILTMSEEKVEFENNTYIYSGGRQAWNYFNIFMKLGGDPEGKEKTILKSAFTKEPRTKRVSHIVDEKININLLIDNKEHTVTNDISLFSLTEKAFKNPMPNQKKES